MHIYKAIIDEDDSQFVIQVKNTLDNIAKFDLGDFS